MVSVLAGKYRTGVLDAILMWMLDFNEDAIITEYLRLDQRVVDDGNKSMREDHQFSDDIIQKLEPMHQVKELYIMSYFNEIKKRYQTVENYLLEHFGINEEMIKKFQSRILIDA